VELDQRSSVVSGDVGVRIASNGPFLGDGVEVSVGLQVEMLNPASHLLGDSIFIRQGATVYFQPALRLIAFRDLITPPTIVNSAKRASIPSSCPILET